MSSSAIAVMRISGPRAGDVFATFGGKLPEPRKAVLRGWCFADDGRKLNAVRAVLPDRTVEGTYGFKRLDVVASVRNKPQAEYCGWKIDVEFATSDMRLDLEVADENGAWHRFFHTSLRVGEGFGPLDLTSYEKWLAKPEDAAVAGGGAK